MPHNLSGLIGRFILLLTLSSAQGLANVPSYLERLADCTDQWRDELDGMQPSVEQAAKDIIAGGHLYSDGPQGGFAIEALRRAGGLMLLKQYSSDVTLTSLDTLLIATTTAPDDGLLSLLESARQAGAQVVLFDAGHHLKNQPEFTVLPRNIDADKADISTTSMSNVIGMWAWTGRFIAKCVSLGHMPCLYQSYALPGGAERGAFLQRYDMGRFHAMTAVKPNDAEQIANAYLVAIEDSLRSVWNNEQSSLHRAASLLRDSRKDDRYITLHTVGHLYPGEMEQPQQPRWVLTEDQITAETPLGPAILLQYQEFPWNLVLMLQEADRPIILTCSQPALATFTNDPRHVYINPYWPMTDGVVSLPGYDVKLLPASGVMTTAVYWQVMELVHPANQE